MPQCTVGKPHKYNSKLCALLHQMKGCMYLFVPDVLRRGSVSQSLERRSREDE
jgi:hypothetical protein